MSAEFANEQPVARVSRQRHHRFESRGVQLDHFLVLGTFVRKQTFEQRLHLGRVHPALAYKELDGSFVRGHQAGKRPHLGRHIRHGGALIDAKVLHGFARVLHHLADGVPLLHVRVTQDLQHEILGGEVRRLPAVDPDQHGRRHGDAHVVREP